MINNTIADVLKGWLPYQFITVENKLLLRWLFVNDEPFTEPFFDDTIAKCRRLPENTKPFKSVTEISPILDWASSLDSIKPTAFIFHISRCGSTLVSQLLSMNNENISLSEVPLFDAILRMPYKQQANEKTAGDILKAAIKFYAVRRNGNEKRVFIKTDSWHLLFYKQLRALYPDTPFVILYRKPAEVIFSQQRKKGMHAVRGLIEPALFGLNEEAIDNVYHEDYISLVIEKYFETIIEIAGSDQRFLLVNYNEGISTIMKKIAAIVGMELNQIDTELFAERSRYHSKDSTEKFSEKFPDQPIKTPNIIQLENLYNQVEKLRLS